MKTIIDPKSGYVAKHFRSKSDAERYYKLYQSFQYHVPPTSTTENVVIYKYMNGITLRERLQSGADNQLVLILKRLGIALAANHQNHRVLPINYGQICSFRNIYKDRFAFLPSAYYVSNIHGDLNTGNIIIQNNNVFFIDRLSSAGDMMFDFTFVMSLLCLYFAGNGKVYLEAIREFFREYEVILVDPGDFYVGFRNNFINYGVLVHSDTKHLQQFPEWKYGKEVSSRLTTHTNFMDFLDSL